MTDTNDWRTDWNNEQEKKSFDPGPLPANSDGEILDYGEQLAKITTMRKILEDSLPRGQRIRSNMAYKELREAVMNLERWLKIKGVV